MKGTIFGIVVTVLAILLAIVLVIGSFAGRWLGAASDVAGPDNVRHQFRKAYQLHEGLPSLRANVEAKRREIEAFREDNGDPSTWSQAQRDRMQMMRSKVTAYETQYNRLAREYNAQMRDVWQGRVVGPPDLPDKVEMFE